MNHRLEATVTHAFLDARLDAVETRMDARIDRIEQRMNALEQRMDQLAQTILHLQAHLDKSMASMKSHLLLTAISTVVAIVLGVAAFNASIVGSVTSAFDSGRQSAAILARIEAQQRQHDQLLQDWAQQQRQQQPPQRG